MQENISRRSNQARTAETRAALIRVARQLFAEQGYAATGTPQIVKQAGVTRGALYHHFADKVKLFEAVIRQEAQEVAEKISVDTIKSSSPIDALTAGSHAYFDAISAPGRARLLLIEGPLVLGHAAMAGIDRESGGGELKAGLDSAVADGTFAPMRTDIIAELLSAVFDQAALAISAGADPQPYHTAVALILEGLARTSNQTNRV